MIHDNDDTTPSEEILIRYNADLEAAKTPSDAQVIYDHYLSEFPEHQAALTEFLDLKLKRLHRFGISCSDQPKRLLRQGDRLAVFTIKRYVTSGGMGEIYQAEQDDVARLVALKVSTLPISALETTARHLAEQFVREYRVPAQLHQTNVVPIYYSGQAEVRGRNIWYYVMQYIDGASLKDVLDSAFQLESSTPASAETPPLVEVVQKHLPVSSKSEGEPGTNQVKTSDCQKGDAEVSEDGYRRAKINNSQIMNDVLVPNSNATSQIVDRLARAQCPVCFQSHGRNRYYDSVAHVVEDISEAVGYLHANGYRHRDIKPANTMLDKEGRCYLIDFGLADKLDNDTLEANNTQQHMIESGTMEYMAPEQFRVAGQTPIPIGPAADVYSLGATLYELITFRPAFRSTNPLQRIEVVERIIKGEYRHPRQLVANVPMGLVKICAKAMALNPSDRYPTATALAADLKRWRNWQPTIAHPGRWTFRPLRLWIWRNTLLAFLLFVITVLIAATPVAYMLQAAQYQERERQFQETVQVSRDIQNSIPYAGWSEESRANLLTAKKLIPDADLRNYAVNTLIGPDARYLERHILKEQSDEKVVGMSGIVFGPNDQLLTGGYQASSKTTVDISPALLFDASYARPPIKSTLPGEGPIAFLDADTPVQLVLPSGLRTQAVLWNIAKNKMLLAIDLPETFRHIESMTAALASNGQLAAISATQLPDKNGQRTGETILWALDPKLSGGTGKILTSWKQPASALAFSPDGKYLAAGTYMGKVGMYDTASGQVRFTLHDNRLPILSLAFGRNYKKDATDRPQIEPDGIPGLLLATGSDAGNSTVWNLETKNRINVFRSPSYYVNALAFSPDGSQLAALSGRAPIIWDIATATATFALTPNRNELLQGYKTGIAYSSSGCQCAFAISNDLGETARLQIVHFDHDRGIQTYHGLSGNVEKVLLSPSGKWLAATSHNWEVSVWDRATGRLKYVWDMPVGWSADNCDIAFDLDEESLYFSSGERVTRLNLTTGERTGRWVVPLGLSDRLVVTKGKKPILLRTELQSQLVRNAPRPFKQFVCRELLENGQFQLLYTFPADFGPYSNVTMSATGRYLALTTQNNQRVHRLHLFHGQNGKPIEVPSNVLARNVASITFSRDETMIVANCYDSNTSRNAYCYKLPELALHAIHQKNYFRQLDEKMLIATGHDSIRHTSGLSLYQVGETMPLVTFDDGRITTANSQSLSADGKYCYWGRVDGTVLVADINKCLAYLAQFAGKNQK